jgi:beta-glucosidase-like glycosyl hydrolase
MLEPGVRTAATPVDARVADLVARMELTEKAAQLLCPFLFALPDRQLSVEESGVGGVAWPLSAPGTGPPEAAAAVDALQRQLVEQTRLGVPALFNEEAVCGLRVPEATMGPDAIGQAATWNPELVGELAGAYGRQMRATGIRQALSPLCDVAPDPRWGRIEETYGEDPYLVGCMATAFVAGLQAPGNVATLKHFIAYGTSHGGRNTDSSTVGPVELHEIYGLPFEMAIRLGGARAVMCSYQSIDRMPVQGSRALLTDLLRGEYGFSGIVISDLGSVEQLLTKHAVVESLPAAVARSVWAGLDLELCSTPSLEHLLEAVRSGLLPESEVDRAVGNLLRLKFELGLFDEPYVDPSAVPDSLDSAADRALARRVAEESIVLLQNRPVDGDPLLPIGPQVRRIAVIGPTADRPMALLGNYSFLVLGSALERMRAAVMAGLQPDEATVERTPPDAEVRQQPEKVFADEIEPLVSSVPVVTVLEGIRRAAGEGVTVVHARGCPVEEPDESGIPEAVELARTADLAVVVGGDQAGIFGGATVGEFVDGATLALPGVQEQLVAEVAASGTPTVLVLTHGRPYALGRLADTVPAIVSAFFPGEEGGSAVASVLFGSVNPAGRLPVSFPRSPGVCPSPYNRPHFGTNTYFDADDSALYPFGHGLSYTGFAYGDLSIEPDEIRTDGTANVSVTITNTGTRVGAEVVQLYLRDPVARSVRPRRELKGFAKVTVEPGRAVRVSFGIAADRCAVYDPAEGWLVEPGRIDVLVGSSSEDIRARGAFELTGPVRAVGADRALLTPVVVEPVDPTGGERQPTENGRR